MTTVRCHSCPGPPFSIVLPSIPTSHSPYLFLGAGPGRRENDRRVVYCGQAGEEFDNTYLTAAGMRRENVCVGNARQCWDGTSRTPTGAACLDCARTHIPALLERVRPEVVVLMGGAAQPLSDARVRLEMQHGIPFKGSLLNGAWEGWVWPMYEPALGMRETSRMTQLLEDFRNLGRWVRGEWEPPVPVEEEKDYQLIHTRSEFNQYVFACAIANKFEGILTRHCHAADTETDGGQPWSVQFSNRPHTGRMILAGNRELLSHYNSWLHNNKAEMILHFAGQDLDTLAKMGIEPVSYRDTGQEAYHLCSLPQGLKPLAYRLLGVTMRSWEDVVRPASVAAISSWMEDAIGLAETNLQDMTITHLKIGVCRGCGKRGKAVTCKVCGGPVLFDRAEYSPSTAQNILRHILTYTAKTEEEDEPYDPWKALERMRVEGLRGKKAEGWEWQFLEGELGPIPILSIANAALPDACEYAIGDANYTGQIAVELERLRGSEKWRVDEEDVDV